MSERKERELWSKGLLSWDAAIERCEEFPDPEKARRLLCQSKQECERKNHLFFCSLLPRNEHWRAYKDFSDKTCFLDIETTGLSKHYCHVTTVGLHDCRGTRVLVKDQDVCELPRLIKDYSMIVTFNGAMFDLPWLRHEFGIEFDQFHIDLRFVLKRLGYSGGLKSIEKQLNITRDDEVGGIGGFEAVMLWKRYCRGDVCALEKLKKYNAADVENLRTLMEFASEKMRSSLLHEGLK